jgi:hypothetical protein
MGDDNYLPLLSFKGVGTRTSTTDETTRDRLETALLDALTEVAKAGTDRSLTRLRSPKQRKGTRHFTPEFPVDTRVGTKALDAPRVVDADRWVEDVHASVTPLIEAAAEQAAAQMLVDLGYDGIKVAAWNSLSRRARVLVHTARQSTVSTILTMVSDAARGRADALAAALNAADQGDATIDDLIKAVGDYAARNLTWAAGVARQAATATLEGARDALAVQVRDALMAENADPNIVRQWISRLDEKVRDTHRKAHGQTVAVGEPFSVGGVLLDYPGDPSAPPALGRNCRCRTMYRHRLSGRFVARPSSEPQR